MISDLLVPHDLTDFADRALEAVEDLQLQVRRQHVVHVLPRIDLTYPGVVWSRDEDEERRRHALEALGIRLDGTRWADATRHVVIGDPAARVVELAKEISANLIVIPSHGRTGLKRLMLGSVAEHVARFAPCPVLVLPQAAAAHSLAGDAVPVPVGAADRSATEQVDALGCEVCDRVAERDGYLTAVRVGLPEGADAAWWEDALERRLSEAGVDYVDITFSRAGSGVPMLLDLRFEDP